MKTPEKPLIPCKAELRKSSEGEKGERWFIVLENAQKDITKIADVWDAFLRLHQDREEVSDGEAENDLEKDSVKDRMTHKIEEDEHGNPMIRLEPTFETKARLIAEDIQTIVNSNIHFAAGLLRDGNQETQDTRVAKKTRKTEPRVDAEISEKI